MSARTVSLRNAVAAACALVIAFIGVVHEVVGTTLYPEGPPGALLTVWMFACPAGESDIQLAQTMLLAVGFLFVVPLLFVPAMLVWRAALRDALRRAAHPD